ncbi:MAG: tRNA ((37)-N6)-threonylcarbamoyltransferase complex ATPase subunit type 1 TsaE [Actinomycetota bacterium]|jgi:tRNA threonylcarbamoyl adenosine modification protein YjeE
MKLSIQSAQEMEQLGVKLASLLKLGDLVLLAGPLGAGKTTLTRGIGKGLVAEGTIQSPTFVLARTHRLQKGKLVHVDAYRLSSAIELDDLDIDFENSIVIVEWARDFLDGYSKDFLTIDIDRTSEDETRVVSFIPTGNRWSEVSFASLN